MNDISDQDLLRRFATQGEDEAFTELVKRHCNLVWAAARRMSGNGELARDVSQIVFTDLARKAGRLPRNTVLAGWLYRAACHATANHLRTESRRLQREQQAMQPDTLQTADGTDMQAVTDLQPLLDRALGELGESDRDAVVLRFLAGRSLAEIGVVLGTNEDAAQKRVSRALEKLRESLRRSGVDVSGGVVAAALSVAAAQAAPAGLAPGIASAALLAAGTTAGGFLWFMNMKTAIGLVGGVAAVAGLVWQQQAVSRLTAENEALRRDLAKPPAVVVAPAPPADGEAAKLAAERNELLRLRGEVARLRRTAVQAGNSSQREGSASVDEAVDLPPQVMIEARFVEAPDSVLAQLGVAPAQNSKGLVAASQLKYVLNQLEKTAGVDVLGLPRVTTLSGRTANLSINSPPAEELDSDTVKAEGPGTTTVENVPASVSAKPALNVEVTPTVPAGSQQIELAITAGYFHAIAAGAGSGSAGGGFGGSVGFVPETKITVPDGQTLLMRQPAQVGVGGSTDSGPRSLLVFVTPVLIDPAGRRLYPEGQ